MKASKSRRNGKAFVNEKKAKRGRFIVLDGPDGVGKTTHARILSAELQRHGVTVNALREPGGTALGEAIRKMLLDQTKIHIDALAETFLFQAARAQLIREVIVPALDRGEWIICDRFTLSTLVYQGYAGGIKKKTIKELSDAAIDGVKPDAYFVLCLPSEISAERRAIRKADRMESKGDTYLDNVFKGFTKEAKQRGNKYKMIDGRGSEGDVQKRIWAHVEKLLGVG
jgi:dTMP kinase